MQRAQALEEGPPKKPEEEGEEGPQKLKGEESDDSIEEDPHIFAKSSEPPESDYSETASLIQIEGESKID